MKTYTDAIERGIFLGIQLARDCPDLSPEELAAYCKSVRDRVKSLSNEDLKTVTGGDIDL